MMRILWASLLAACACAQPSVEDLLAARTTAALEDFAAHYEGVVGVTALDLTSGRRLTLHSDTVFPQASVIKVPILVTMYHAARAGKLRLDDKVTVQPAQAVPGGNLETQLKKGPLTLTIRQLAEAMIIDSDNTATNVCIDLVGMDAVNRMLESRGYPHTRLQRKMMDAQAALESRENLSTPNEMARMLEEIYRAKLVDAASRDEILAIMKRVPSGMEQGLPLDTVTASKVGALPGTRSETGIVYLEHRPFILSIMSAYIEDQHTPVPEVTRIVFGMFQKLDQSNALGRRIR